MKRVFVLNYKNGNYALNNMLYTPAQNSLDNHDGGGVFISTY